MAHKVFISHSSKDKQVADAACAALEAQRIPCWIAPRDILAGVEWGDAIIDAISTCQVVVLIFSQEANSAPMVRKEISVAVSEEKIIVPFRIENISPSGAMKLALGNTHWLDALTPPLERRLAELCDTISRLIQRKTATGSGSAEPGQSGMNGRQPVPPQEARRRTAWETPAASTVPDPPPASPVPPPLAPRTAIEGVRKPSAAVIEKAGAPLRPTLGKAAQDAGKPARELPHAATGPGLRKYSKIVKDILYVLALILFFVVLDVVLYRVFKRWDVAPQTKPESAQQAAASPDSSLARNPDSARTTSIAPLKNNSVPTTDSKPAVIKPDASPAEQQGIALYGQKRYSEAMPLLDKACAGGSWESCTDLGLMFDQGRGVAKDYSHAISLYSKACDASYGTGCNNLGVMYEDGRGLAKDDSQALALFSKGCSGGDADSCGNLGAMYSAGAGVPKDLSRAGTLLAKACDGGRSFYCYSLGLMYANGDFGVNAESKEANLFSKACDLGEPVGCYELGTIYQLGQGVTMDPKKARQFMSKSCTMGYQQGCDQLKRMKLMQ
jgi:hypothetical protein